MVTVVVGEGGVSTGTRGVVSSTGVTGVRLLLFEPTRRRPRRVTGGSVEGVVPDVSQDLEV